jgi:hypothetical protein
MMGDALQLKSWEDRASSARARRDAGIAKVEPKLEGIPDILPLSSQELPKSVLTPREIEITEKYSVTELLKILRERKISVEEVTRAFLRRAALAQAAVRVIQLHASLLYITAKQSLILTNLDQLSYRVVMGQSHSSCKASGFLAGT